MTPDMSMEKLKKYMSGTRKSAFLAAFLTGLFVHLPVMLSDIPNHDGLASMYFDQNMITSGRWFLTVACGLSSYFTIPWIIGVLGLFFLSLTAVALTEVLECKSTTGCILIGMLLAVFPALSSTFAYVFTLDGYMLALLFATLSVLFTKKYHLGFLPGAVCLALSMGTYQAYLSFAVLLCLYRVWMICLSEGSYKEKAKRVFRYFYMGVLGMLLYYGILQLLLWIEGKKLDTYQGINGMASGTSLTEGIARMYQDFVAFSGRGRVLFNDAYSLFAIAVLALVTLLCLGIIGKKRKLWKNPWFFVIIGVSAVILPAAFNLILLVSPGVTYHLLMRYQWILVPICMVAFVEYACTCPGEMENLAGLDDKEKRSDDIALKNQEKHTMSEKSGGLLSWLAVLAALVLVLHYAVTDNIAYSNLEKKYEKTYAYCLRLLDRIEQTPGYYQGIPIAMIGVVGDEQFPATDITGKATSNMIGMNGDYLLYTGPNYQSFMKHYLGATLNILEAEAMQEMYYDEEYVQMGSFPAADSIKIINGIMYIKTENEGRN